MPPMAATSMSTRKACKQFSPTVSVANVSPLLEERYATVDLDLQSGCSRRYSVCCEDRALHIDETGDHKPINRKASQVSAGDLKSVLRGFI